MARLAAGLVGEHHSGRGQPRHRQAEDAEIGAYVDGGHTSAEHVREKRQLLFKPGFLLQKHIAGDRLQRAWDGKRDAVRKANSKRVHLRPLRILAITHSPENFGIELQQRGSADALRLDDLVRKIWVPKRRSFDGAEPPVHVDRIKPGQCLVGYPMDMRDVEKIESRVGDQSVKRLEVAHIRFADHDVGLLQNALCAAEDLCLRALNVEFEKIRRLQAQPVGQSVDC